MTGARGLFHSKNWRGEPLTQSVHGAAHVPGLTQVQPIARETFVCGVLMRSPDDFQRYVDAVHQAMWIEPRNPSIKPDETGVFWAEVFPSFGSAE